MNQSIWLAGVLTVLFAAAAQAEINVKTDLVEYMRTRGGTVFFPPGRYILNTHVRFTQEPGRDLELSGDHAVICGTAPILMGAGSRVLVEKKLTQPAGAFDTVLHVPDVKDLAVGDLVGVHSRGGNDWPAQQGDGSGGVEHLAHIAAFFDPASQRLRFRTPEGWRGEGGNMVK